MELKIYNSFTKEKEVFKPITEGYLGLYVCGPTVSGESHLGHARPYITFDVVNRYFKYLGYKVRYVRNITDAGHFEEENKEAIDKISDKAILEKMEPMELIQKYTNLFHSGMNLFNCLEPDIEPTVTGHIIEQIDMILSLIDKGYAYVVNGSVYFNVIKYSENYKFGELSGRIIENQLEGIRNTNTDEKRNVADFALWKKAPDNHLMRWNSPWGIGFPGWHIECSAMSSKYLGKTFDIHGGGMDLQFPHHECEIAQSTVVNGCTPAKYWMHNNMITINSQKMGKSYNNVIKLSELFSGNHPLLEQPYHPMVVRFYILQSHYRSQLDFSNEALKSAEIALKKLWEAYDYLNTLPKSMNFSGISSVLSGTVNKYVEQCYEFINDDFNTARVIGNFFNLVSIINSIKMEKIHVNDLLNSTLVKWKKTFKLFIEDIFGLQTFSKVDDRTDEILSILLNVRKNAKLRNDYNLSDDIRKQLAIIGIELKDDKNGKTTYKINGT